jgi:tellurite resistance protein
MWVHPWMHALTMPWMAEGLRQLHPLRLQRYGWSDANPFVWPLAAWSAWVEQNRQPVSAGNPFVAAETYYSNFMIASLNLYRDTRDRMQEWIFKSIYNNPWVTFWWGGQPPPKDVERPEEQIDHLRRQELAYARKNAGLGGFPEAVIRIIIAVTGVDRVMDKRQIEAADSIVRPHERFQHLSSAEIKQMVRNQARILAAHTDLALAGLAGMLPTQSEREEAFDIAIKIAIADFRVDLGERQLLTRIRKALGLHQNDLYE